jgi:hypothetical protein
VIFPLVKKNYVSKCGGCGSDGGSSNGGGGSSSSGIIIISSSSSSNNNNNSSLNLMLNSTAIGQLQSQHEYKTTQNKHAEKQ